MHLLGKGHFIVKAMYSTVALPANIYASLKLLFGVMLFEIRATMHFLRDKMMKG
jgi:hypothetical protein